MPALRFSGGNRKNGFRFTSSGRTPVLGNINRGLGIAANSNLNLSETDRDTTGVSGTGLSLPMARPRLPQRSASRVIKTPQQQTSQQATVTPDVTATVKTEGISYTKANQEPSSQQSDASVLPTVGTEEYYKMLYSGDLDKESKWSPWNLAKKQAEIEGKGGDMQYILNTVRSKYGSNIEGNSAATNAYTKAQKEVVPNVTTSMLTGFSSQPIQVQPMKARTGFAEVSDDRSINQENYADRFGLKTIESPTTNELAGNNGAMTVWWSGTEGSNTKVDPITGETRAWNTSGDNTTLTFGDGTVKRYSSEEEAKKAYLDALNSGLVAGDRYGETQRLLSGASGAQTGAANVGAITEFAKKSGYTVERDPVTGYIRSITKDKDPVLAPESFSFKGETGSTLTSKEAEDLALSRGDEIAPQIQQANADMQQTASSIANSLSGMSQLPQYDQSVYEDPNRYNAELAYNKAQSQKTFNDLNNLLLQTRESSIRNIMSAYNTEKFVNFKSYMDNIVDSTGRRLSGDILAVTNADGTTTYKDSRLVDMQSRDFALGIAEAEALNQAQKDYTNGQFDLAGQKMSAADAYRKERRDIGDKIQDQRKTELQLKAMEQESAQNTITTLVNSGMSPEKIGDDYFAYLDKKSQLPLGTSRGLYDFSLSYKTNQDAMQTASDLVKITSSLPPGSDFYVDGNAYGKFNSGDVQTHYEVQPDGNTTVSIVDKKTGNIMNSINIGYTGQTYEDYKDDSGIVTRVFPDGTSRTMYNPNLPNGGYATGGICDIFPEGDTFGQCGRFVNTLKGTSFGDSFENKMSKTDPTITPENAQQGDIVVQNIGGWTGHVAIINSKFEKDGKIYFRLSESNYNGDERVTHTREVSADEVSGYARQPFVSEDLNFSSSDSSGERQTPVVVLSQEQKETFNKLEPAKKLEGGRRFRNALVNYKNYIDKYGGAILSREQKQQLRSLYGEITGALKSGEQLGTLDKGLMEYTNKRIPDAEKLIGLSRPFTSAGAFSSTLSDIIGRVDKDAEMYYNDVIAQYPEYDGYSLLQEYMKSYGYSL